MNKKSPYYAFGVYGALGFQIGAAIGVGTFGGQWLDEKFGTSPWLMLTGVLLGCGVGGVSLVKLLKEQAQDQAESENHDESK